MKEINIQNTIRLTYSKGDCRLWRNNVGEAKTLNGCYIKYGLCPDSSDLVGIKTIRITPEMVGKDIGVAIFAEVKTEKGIVSIEQQNFLDLCIDMGCIAGVVRSPEHMKILLDSYIANLQS